MGFANESDKTKRHYVQGFLPSHQIIREPSGNSNPTEIVMPSTPSRECPRKSPRHSNQMPQKAHSTGRYVAESAAVPESSRENATGRSERCLQRGFVGRQNRTSCPYRTGNPLDEREEPIPQYEFLDSPNHLETAF